MTLCSAAAAMVSVGWMDTQAIIVTTTVVVATVALLIWRFRTRHDKYVDKDAS